MSRGFLAASLLGAGIVLLVAGCGGGDDSAKTTTTQGTGKVEAFDFGYRPNSVVVKAGTEVTWTNTGKLIHTVKQLPESKEKFFSKALETDATYSHRFDKPGRYPYFCTLHPTQMKGTVVVR